MIDAHEVVDYLKEHFNQSDTQIVLLLSQGVLLMKKRQQRMMNAGYVDIPGFDDYLLLKLEKMDAYLSDVIEEELHDRL